MKLVVISTGVLALLSLITGSVTLMDLAFNPKMLVLELLAYSVVCALIARVRRP